MKRWALRFAAWWLALSCIYVALAVADHASMRRTHPRVLPFQWGYKVSVAMFLAVFHVSAVMGFLGVSYALGRWTKRHKRRARRGLCVACGYDLRGSVGACPECGAERTTL